MEATRQMTRSRLTRLHRWPQLSTPSFVRAEAVAKQQRPHDLFEATKQRKTKEDLFGFKNKCLQRPSRTLFIGEAHGTTYFHLYVTSEFWAESLSYLNDQISSIIESFICYHDPLGSQWRLGHFSNMAHWYCFFLSFCRQRWFWSLPSLVLECLRCHLFGASTICFTNFQLYTISMEFSIPPLLQ